MDFSNQNLVHLLNQQARFLNKQMNEKLKAHDLYTSQWAILYCLYTNGSMTQTAIWQYLNVEAPTVTRTITRLVEKGWVTREQGTDKRERIIRITEGSEATLDELATTVRSYEDEELLDLTEEEENQLRHILLKLGSKEENNHNDSS